MTDLSSTPPSGPVALLPVVQTVGDAYRFTLQRIGQVLTAAVVPFGMSMSMGLIEAGFGGGVFSLLAALVNFFAYAIFAVAWHRALLVGEAPRLVPQLGLRQVRFWGRSLLVFLIFLPLSLLAAVVMAPLLLMSEPSSPGDPSTLLVVLPLLLVFGYLFARCSFVFPAAAVDESFGFGASWRTTAGNAWRLVGAYLLAILPMLVGVLLLLVLGSAVLGLGAWMGGPGEAAAPVAGGLAALVLIVALLVVNYVCAAVLISLLSLAFRTCTGWVPDSGPQPPVPGGPASPQDDEGHDARYH